MEKKEYAGWTNYETWAANLWITENFSNDVRDFVENFREKKDGVYKLEKKLEDLIKDNAPEIKDALYSSLLSRAIYEINFTELAEAYMSD